VGVVVAVVAYVRACATALVCRPSWPPNNDGLSLALTSHATALLQVPAAVSQLLTSGELYELFLATTLGVGRAPDDTKSDPSRGAPSDPPAQMVVACTVKCVCLVVPLLR